LTGPPPVWQGVFLLSPYDHFFFFLFLLLPKKIKVKRILSPAIHLYSIHECPLQTHDNLTKRIWPHDSPQHSIDVPQSMQHWDHGATTCSSVRATLESWSMYLFDTMSALKVSNGIYALRSLFFYASVLMMILLSMIWQWYLAAEHDDNPEPLQWSHMLLLRHMILKPPNLV